MAEKSIPKTLKQCHKLNNPTKTPFLSDIFLQKNLQKWPIKVNFQGWRKPHQNWPNWVEKLSLKFAKTWELSGICDGILASLHEIKPNPEIILGLCEFWCCETNTFMFPWGEATITLEDINVLLGLPVLGNEVDFTVVDNGLCMNSVSKLRNVKNALFFDGSTINECDNWIKYFSMEVDDDVEHLGFLAFWVSSFLFSDLNDTSVGSLGFPVAVRLAQGEKMALGPAVLAWLYRNMSFITKHAADFDSAKKVVSVPGPFQILQVWALERFPLLGSNLAKPLKLGQPRIGRWDKVSLKVSLVDVRKVLRSSGESFCWRPYASELKNWRCRSFNVDVEKICSDFSGDVDDELRSFHVCLQPRVLIGVDCTATYLPQRVMMQFGCSQEVNLETVFCSPLESGNVRLSEVEKSSELSDNALCKGQMTDNGNEISEGLEQKSNDEDCKKPIQSNDNSLKMEVNQASVSPEIEVLNVSVNDSKTRDEQNLECLVVLDSEDDLDEKLERKDVIRSRNGTKNLKRRVGNSADYPLYVAEYSNKVVKRVKKSGISLGNPIDVDNYWL